MKDLKKIIQCIQSEGNLFQGKDADKKPYCVLSFVVEETFCKHLGEKVVVYEKGSDYQTWRRYRRCNK